MPWWFWIITHVWAVSVGIIIAVYIHNDEWGSGWKDIVFGILLHIFAPIVLIVGTCNFLWDEVVKPKIYKWAEGDYHLKRFFENKKRKKEEKEQAEKDFKEMEDNEDEWRIERLGIKSRY